MPYPSINDREFNLLKKITENTADIAAGGGGGGGGVSSVNGQTGVVVLTKANVGLGNADNTSDANKPISNATQAALNGKVPFVNNTFILVNATNNAVTNGTALRAAYTAAKALTPNGQAIGEFNHAVVVVPPGIYDLVTTPLTLNADYVDIVSLTGDPDHVTITSQITAASSATVIQGNNWILLAGLSIDNTASTRSANDDTDASALRFLDGSSKLTLKKCKFYDGGGSSWGMVQGFTFGANVYDSINFISNLFGSNGGGFDGEAKNCVAGNNSFGGGGNFGGVAFDCQGGAESFGGGATGTVSGTLTRCEGRGDLCFGGDSVGQGAMFTDCHSIGNNCFGGTNRFDGSASRCSAGTHSFGDGGLGNGGTSTLDACTAGTQSFGQGGAIFNGTRMRGCVGGAFSFGDSVQSGVIMIACVAAGVSFGKTTFSGKCIGCFAQGHRNWGGDGTFNGQLIDCVIVDGSLTNPWAPPTAMAGSVSGVVFDQQGADLDAVTLAEDATTEFEFCTFRKNGTGTPMGLAAGAATPKISYCKFNTVAGVAAGITNVLGATLADAFNIGDVDV